MEGQNLTCMAMISGGLPQSSLITRSGSGTGAMNPMLKTTASFFHMMNPFQVGVIVGFLAEIYNVSLIFNYPF